MLFAFLAKFLLGQPLAVQAVALGLSTGLFVAAATEANERVPTLGSTAVLVLCWGAAAAALFHAGGVALRRRGLASEHAAPRWLYVVYAVVWLGGLVAASMALFGAGGISVALLAVVPLVLLGPTALYGMAHLARRAQA